MTETEAKKAYARGGIYESSDRVDNPPGWWVQYRVVLRISPVEESVTGERTYDVYLSEIIPTPANTGGHDASYLSPDHYWLWMPEGVADPWKWQVSGSAEWVFKAGYPIQNPDNFALTRTTTHTREDLALYGLGVGINFWQGNKQTNVSDAEWYFRLTHDGMITSTLIPGDRIWLHLHADASGAKMNHHIGGELTVYSSGFEIDCDPPTGSYRRPGVFAGRAGNGTMIPESNQSCYFIVPDYPADEISLSFYVSGWGTTMTYVWEKRLIP